MNRSCKVHSYGISRVGKLDTPFKILSVKGLPVTPHRTVHAVLVGRPGEFHPQPPIEPYVKLSLHTAPRSPRILLRFPCNSALVWISVSFLRLELSALCSLCFRRLLRYYGLFCPCFAPSLLSALLYISLTCAFRLTCAVRFPSFAVKAHIRFLPPIHRSLSLPVNRYPQRLSAPMREKCLLVT